MRAWDLGHQGVLFDINWHGMALSKAAVGSYRRMEMLIIVVLNTYGVMYVVLFLSSTDQMYLN